MNAYEERIQKAVSFIEGHYAEPLTLNDLAKAANFSMYHFSRIFQSITGVSPMRYVKEVRLKNAARLILNSGKQMTEIAYECGFDSISNFNASFQQHFHAAPGSIRKQKNSKNEEVSGKIQEALGENAGHTLNKSLLRRVWDMNVRIKEFPSKRAAYFRHTGSYLDTAGNWRKLLKWVSVNNLFRRDAEFIGMSLDDPESTEDDACRHDACITLPEGFDEQNHPEVNFKTIDGGLYAVYRFYDTVDKMLLAFRSLYGEWLPQSGYEADNKPPLEINLNNPADDPEGKGKCDICIPVVKKE